MKSNHLKASTNMPLGIKTCRWASQNCPLPFALNYFIKTSSKFSLTEATTKTEENIDRFNNDLPQNAQCLVSAPTTTKGREKKLSVCVCVSLPSF